MDANHFFDAVAIGLGVAAGLLALYQELEKKNHKSAAILFGVAVLIAAFTLLEAPKQGILSQRQPENCSNRPCVDVVEVKLVDDPPRLAVRFRNSGGLPAFHVEIRMRAWADNDFDLNQAGEEMLSIPGSSGTLGHDMWESSETPLILDNYGTLERLEAVMAGKVRSGVFGELQYEDSLGNHYSPRFCVNWSARLQDFVVCGRNKFIDGQKP